jgi:hypothetical protein
VLLSLPLPLKDTEGVAEAHIVPLALLAGEPLKVEESDSVAHEEAVLLVLALAHTVGV